ncbi:hypothetical protein CPB84DRAFT_1786173 [Gymnopilus junonius]|uniref:Uncharacterized protein n=1 Tax=Gymnopilus junonius TaxID=109634 RepID=A0A9P5NJE3_GYMJU|nr:hypothetical protein CPB84DRAFT_1786173 [Gymnopilus junonius]
MWKPQLAPSFVSRDPPTGPSFYQRMGTSRAGGRPIGGHEGSTIPANTSPPSSLGASQSQLLAEPPKAPRALRQSMLGNRVVSGGSGGAASPGSGGAASPVNSSHAHSVSIPSPYTRPLVQSHSHTGLAASPPNTSTPSFVGSGVQASQSLFIPRGPSADRERDRDRDYLEREKGAYRFGDKDRDGRDAGRDGVGVGSLRDRLDWDRYPRSGPGLRRFGR